MTTLHSFFIVGISVDTNKKEDNPLHDITGLWNTFKTENIIEQIPNKVDNTVYAVYTNYESDYTEGYTMVLGCKVDNLDAIPKDFTSVSITEGNYKKYTAKGDLNNGIVVEEWKKIWNSDLKRKYSTDFEVYGEKAMNPSNAEVDIFIGI